MSTNNYENRNKKKESLQTNSNIKFPQKSQLQTNHLRIRFNWLKLHFEFAGQTEWIKLSKLTMLPQSTNKRVSISANLHTKQKTKNQFDWLIKVVFVHVPHTLYSNQM